MYQSLIKEDEKHYDTITCTSKKAQNNKHAKYINSTWISLTNWFTTDCRSAGHDMANAATHFAMEWYAWKKKCYVNKNRLVPHRDTAW